jgi:NAD(P)-dependent dehydrogenase (short-subunit alcohol dehydrogenase family)
MNQIDLTGQTAVITGGAQGLGFAIARRIVASGAKVSLWDVDAGELQKAAAELGEGAGPFRSILPAPKRSPTRWQGPRRKAGRSPSSSIRRALPGRTIRSTPIPSTNGNASSTSTSTAPST